MTFTSSYLTLDGIEFKISDSLEIPKFEGLSSDFRMKDPTDLILRSEYDFSKERKVLSWIEEKRTTERKMAEQEEKRRQQSLKRRADSEKQKMEELLEKQREVLQRQRELFLEQKRRQQENKENGIPTPDRASPNQDGESARISPTSENVSEELPPPLPPKNPFSQVGNSNILTPLPAVKKAQASSPLHQSRLNQSQPVLSGQGQIWADFEEEELDPFSNMELKTIDDMAELQTVLSNVKLAEPPSQNSDFELPTYEEATTSSSAPDMPSASHTSLTDGDTKGAEDIKPLPSTNPFLSDIAEISSKLKTIVKSDTDSPTPDSNGDSPSPHDAATYENVGIHTAKDVNSTKTPQDDSPPPQTPTGLYENISLSEVNEIASKLERPSMRSPTSEKIQTPSSVYEFASDPSAPKKEKSSPIQAIFERKMSQQADDNTVEPPPVYSSIIRPKSRAAKSQELVQDQSVPVTTGINQSHPDLSGLSQSNQAAGITISPVMSRSTRFRPEQHATGFNKNISVQEQINPVPTSSNRLNPAKVLPVSFGAVASSMSTTVLPPISSSSSQVGSAGNYVNITPGSLSDPNLGAKPVPNARKPPVPPRDPVGYLPPIPARGQVSTPQNQFTSIATPQNGAQIDPTTPHSGHSHLYPPYALPQSNGPSVTINSTANSVGFTNTKPEISRPTPPPQKKTLNGPNLSPSTPEISFIAKSRQDRAKFEETMNKALSSLPKNPKPLKIPNSPTPPPTTSHPQPTKPRSPSPNSILIATLSPEEREFVQSVTSMGFDTEATVRAMQKFGLDAKDVIDHLCDVQRIVEQGFSTRMVQDALELFENDNKAVVKYLQQAGQLMDMGFKEEDVRNALKNNNNDQTLAIDQLMSQT